MFFFNNDEKNIEFKNNSIEYAYLSVLANDLSHAIELFKNIDSPRGKWGYSFTSILNGYLDRFPTYFEIRNFLEIDLDFLIKNNKLDYIEMILGSSELLSDINQETYKYIARVMIENKIYNAGKLYLEKAKKCIYNDAELHYLITKYYLHENDYINANHYINECLKILPDYYPAKKIQKEIIQKTNNP